MGPSVWGLEAPQVKRFFFFKRNLLPLSRNTIFRDVLTETTDTSVMVSCLWSSPYGLRCWCTARSYRWGKKKWDKAERRNSTENHTSSAQNTASLFTAVVLLQSMYLLSGMYDIEQNNIFKILGVKLTHTQNIKEESFSGS